MIKKNGRFIIFAYRHNFLHLKTFGDFPTIKIIEE